MYIIFSTHPFCFGNFNLPPAGKGSAGLVLPMQILHQPILGKIFGYDRNIEWFRRQSHKDCAHIFICIYIYPRTLHTYSSIHIHDHSNGILKNQKTHVVTGSWGISLKNSLTTGLGMTIVILIIDIFLSL